MPKRIHPSPRLQATIDEQDGLIHRDQALAFGLTTYATKARLRDRHWRLVLPDVYLTNMGELTYRQRLIAAQLYCGPESAIDAANACNYYGFKAVPLNREHVHVVAPFGSTARNRGFVTVRRTIVPFEVRQTTFTRYVDPATAVIAATRRMRRPKSVLAAMSEAIQQRGLSHAELLRAHIQGPPRNARHADDALEQLSVGIRSVGEADFRALAEASAVLPALEYNVWLTLRCGRIVCVDALIASSAVIHETNGRQYHEREDLFIDMQERHDALTASGLVALHNAPRRLQLRGREVISQVERTHLIYDGRGMPPGVQRLPGPPSRPIAV